MKFHTKSCVVLFCAVNSVQGRIYVPMCKEIERNKIVQGKIVNGDNNNLKKLVEVRCYDYDQTAAFTGNAEFTNPDKEPLKSSENGNFAVKYCDLSTRNPISG